MQHGQGAREGWRARSNHRDPSAFSGGAGASTPMQPSPPARPRPPAPPPPHPQGQVLSKATARQVLANVPHKQKTDMPIIFFGTSEIAWIGQKDVCTLEEGMQQQLHIKGKKNKKFVVAMDQVGWHAPGSRGGHGRGGAGRGADAAQMLRKWCSGGARQAGGRPARRAPPAAPPTPSPS